VQQEPEMPAYNTRVRINRDPGKCACVELQVECWRV
jgi:hypothetical protein